MLLKKTLVATLVAGCFSYVPAGFAAESLSDVASAFSGDTSQLAMLSDKEMRETEGAVLPQIIMVGNTAWRVYTTGMMAPVNVIGAPGAMAGVSGSAWGVFTNFNPNAGDRPLPPRLNSTNWGPTTSRGPMPISTAINWGAPPSAYQSTFGSISAPPINYFPPPRSVFSSFNWGVSTF